MSNIFKIQNLGDLVRWREFVKSDAWLDGFLSYVFLKLELDVVSIDSLVLDDKRRIVQQVSPYWADSSNELTNEFYERLEKIFDVTDSLVFLSYFSDPTRKLQDFVWDCYQGEIGKYKHFAATIEQQLITNRVKIKKELENLISLCSIGNALASPFIASMVTGMNYVAEKPVFPVNGDTYYDEGSEVCSTYVDGEWLMFMSNLKSG